MPSNETRNLKSVSVRVDPDLWDRFREAAKMQNLTIESAFNDAAADYILMSYISHTNRLKAKLQIDDLDERIKLRENLKED
jgi:hypothetical protein